MTKVFAEKELGQALKQGKDSIEIEGDLARKAIGISYWENSAGHSGAAIAIGAGLAIASEAALGAGAIASFAVMAPAVGVPGAGAAASAVLTAAAAGGMGPPAKLRKYNMAKISDAHIVLKK